MSSFKPTKYNLRIFKEFDETTNNIVINASAGSGKTTQLVETLKHIPKNKDAIFLSFNKSIADELRTRVPEHIQVSTLHSFGSRVMYRHFPGIIFDENKFFTTALRLFKTMWCNSVKEKKYYYCYRISRLVELMMLTLTLDEDDIADLANEYDVMILDNEINHALQLYAAVYDNVRKMNFTDMIFQPSIRNIRVPKYDYVFSDESQDFNNCQLALIKKIIKPTTGRLIAVGDPHQAIYGFAGANHESYERIKTMLPNTVELPLSISFRCPVDVVKLAQTIVPSIQWRPGAPKGVVRRNGQVKEINGSDFCICRNTRPLIQVFKELIKEGKKANIKGREIGINIITLINKTRGRTIAQVLEKIKFYISELRFKLFKKGYAKPDEHPQMLKLTEKHDIIEMLGEDYRTLKLLIKRIEEIFVDDDIKGITLSTIHRIKGLEADRVFFLNSFLIPSKYAVTVEQIKQESNLKFVAITRAKKEFIFLDVF